MTMKGPRPIQPKALRPSFGKTGTVTAGNASQISDGAAAVVVVVSERWPDEPLPAESRIVTSASGVAEGDHRAGHGGLEGAGQSE